MRVALTHTTRLDYTADVAEGVMDLRLGPLSDAHQRWERYTLRVAPAAAVHAYTDGFGNTAHLISLARPHRYVEVVAEGMIETLLEDPFALPSEPPAPLTPAERTDYLSPAALVPLHGPVAEMAAPFRPASPQEAFASAQDMMALIHAEFTYRTGVTEVTSTVLDVLEGREGVCQDFAHVMLGLCRAVGVPARYVSGYIVPTAAAQQQIQGPQGQRQLQSLPRDDQPRRGGGASHAWIEAYTPTHGWRGFDPTNNLVANDKYVKVAIGRDYRDVPPHRGTFRGSAGEHLTVDVVAQRLD
jgi:transglutaminase-like putative cysteine protease